jgi:hypothetical protein
MPRLTTGVPRLAAGLGVALCCARAWATAPPNGQAVDVETPHLNPERRRDEIPSPSEQQIETPAPPRHTAIYFIFGFGTPEGLGGFEGVHRFGERLELAAGIGSGFAAETSEPHPSLGHYLQWSVMPRLRLGNANRAFTFGVGLSGGQYTSRIACAVPLDFDGEGMSNTPTSCPTYYTVWTNVEIGGERWSRGGFAFRYYLGFARGTMLGSPSSSDSSFLNFPYIGIGLGYAF